MIEISTVNESQNPGDAESIYTDRHALQDWMDNEDADFVPLSDGHVRRCIELFENLRTAFHEDTSTRNIKIQILTLLPKSWSIPEIQHYFNASRRMIDTARSLLYEEGILATPNLKQGNNFQ